MNRRNDTSIQYGEVLKEFHLNLGRLTTIKFICGSNDEHKTQASFSIDYHPNQHIRAFKHTDLLE
jgi:hypothetical protein